MKLYYFPIAPNPTRVIVYLREKGIGLEEQLVDLREGQQNSPEHLARNPAGALPVLELDDGQYLTESLPIIEYLEELYPQPPMVGTTPQERAQTRCAERRVEQGVLNTVGRIVHATNSPLGLPPNPAVAELETERMHTALARLEVAVGDGPFVMGERVTIADCTLFAGLHFGEFFGVGLDDNYPNLCAWYARFKQRPSAQSAML
ncbi:MAG: glutathione S-transferase family protein [Halioglobus sp.]|nr:glutathione S-transferase family protein [Halioglobus sp.]